MKKEKHPGESLRYGYFFWNHTLFYEITFYCKDKIRSY